MSKEFLFMRQGHIISVSILTHAPNEDVGTHSLFKILTDLPQGENNAFYMESKDLSGIPVENAPANVHDPDRLSMDDLIVFDAHDGLLHTVVRWKGRTFRQHQMSFDWLQQH